ncbi:MAG: hypothetical protein ACW98K_15860 [Candidatus Kariarchaeaceae archaeon]
MKTQRNSIFTGLVLLLLISTTSAGVMYDKTVYDYNIFMSNFTGSSFAYTAVVDVGGKTSLTLEFGTFDTSKGSETLQSIQLDIEVSGEFKFYNPSAVSIPDTETIIVVTTNSNPLKDKDDTHIARFEAGVQTAHIIDDGSLFEQTRAFFINNQVYLGYHKQDTFVIMHYDLQDSKMDLVFDLKQVLSIDRLINGKVTMHDFVTFGDKLYLAGGYTEPTDLDYDEHSFVFEFTLNAEGFLEARELFDVTRTRILSLEPTSGGLWINSHQIVMFDNGSYTKAAYLEYYNGLGVFTYQIPTKVLFDVSDVRLLDSDQFVMLTEGGRRMCIVERDGGEFMVKWCSFDVSPWEFKELDTSGNQIATIMTDFDGGANFYIFEASEPPEQFGSGDPESNVQAKGPEEKSDETLELGMGANMTLLGLSGLLVIRIKKRE